MYKTGLPQNPIGTIASFTAGALAFLLLCQPVAGQDPPTDKTDDKERWSVHFQATAVSDAHGSFAAPYSGVNSLDPHSEFKVSLTSTFFLGLRIRKGLEIYVDPEIAGGKGFSNVTGMAGFSNGEITRVTSATPKPYLARAFIRQTRALGDAVEQVEGDANQLAGR